MVLLVFVMLGVLLLIFNGKVDCKKMFNLNINN